MLSTALQTYAPVLFLQCYRSKSMQQDAAAPTAKLHLRHAAVLVPARLQTETECADNARLPVFQGGPHSLTNMCHFEDRDRRRGTGTPPN